MTDWAATGEMLSGIGTIGGAVARVVVAFLGRSAVTDFERQRQAERKIEHAEKALTVAYQLQSAIQAIRSPMSTASELEKSREEIEKNDWFNSLADNKKQRAIQANVFYQRIRSFQEFYDAGLSTLPFVKAYFGNDAEKSLRELIRARQSVGVYADAYMRDEGIEPEHTRTVASYIWEGGINPDGLDPIKSKTDAAIEQLESVLLPVIKGPAGPKAKK